MEKTWIRERSFNIENGNEDVGGGGWNFVGVVGVFEKAGRGGWGVGGGGGGDGICVCVRSL